MGGDRKRRSFADYLKVAARRVSGAFAALLLRKPKSSSKPAVSDAPGNGRQVSAVSGKSAPTLALGLSAFPHLRCSSSSGLQSSCPEKTINDVLQLLQLLLRGARRRRGRLSRTSLLLLPRSLRVDSSRRRDLRWKRSSRPRGTSRRLT